MNKVIIFILLSILLATGTLWSLEESYGPEDSNKSILIAYEPTRFKTKLLEALIPLLDDGSRYIQIVDHKEGELGPLSADSYQVVLISNSGATAKVRPWVIEWLETNSRDNVIVHTTQTTVWTPQVTVDSVTSASFRARSDIESYAEFLLEKILEKLS